MTDDGRLKTAVRLLLRGGCHRGGLIQQGRHAGRIRSGRHRAFRIQQVFVVRSQAQLDERPGIRDCLTLPAVIGLVAFHRALRFRVPNAGGAAAVQIMFAHQRFLDFAGARSIDLLLPALAGTGLPARFPDLYEI